MLYSRAGSNSAYRNGGYTWLCSVHPMLTSGRRCMILLELSMMSLSLTYWKNDLIYHAPNAWKDVLNIYILNLYWNLLQVNAFQECIEKSLVNDKLHDIILRPALHMVFRNINLFLGYSSMYFGHSDCSSNYALAFVLVRIFLLHANVLCLSHCSDPYICY